MRGMKPGVFQGKKFPFTPKRRKESLGSQCNKIIDTRHDLAASPSKLAEVSWLRSYTLHMPAPWLGERYAVMFFTKVGLGKVSLEDLVLLRSLGFRLCAG